MVLHHSTKTGKKTMLPSHRLWYR